MRTEPITRTITIQDPSAASTAEVALWLGVNHITVNRWIALGCPVVRTKPYLLDIKAVEAWRAARK